MFNLSVNKYLEKMTFLGGGRVLDIFKWIFARKLRIFG